MWDGTPVDVETVFIADETEFLAVLTMPAAAFPPALFRLGAKLKNPAFGAGDRREFI
jgi:hypothetical protein